MELYLGTEDSISQSEIQFLLEQENSKESGNEKETNNEKEEKNEINETKVEEKETKDIATEPITSTVNPNKESSFSFIPIAASAFIILAILFYYLYANDNVQM